MKITSIDTGYFKLDGGAMFGVVPYVIWKKLNPPDENNLCPWAMRCLLVETPTRKILIDTGMGDKQDEKFFSHYYPHGTETLWTSLQKVGIHPSDITDVLLTHLHFDHCGAAVVRNEQGSLVPAFPNATYWTNKSHYDWAFNPNARERASFLKENFVPLMDANVLQFIPEQQGTEWLDGIRIFYVYGHTEAMMLPLIPTATQPLLYAADLIPAAAHIPLPFVMAYDMRPLVTLDEKKYILEQCLEHNYALFFEHDPTHECATLTRLPNGKIVLDKLFTADTLNNRPIA
jgi:glyoxylase-like metal-dependent hydrolase (beta-lactamase superfamily II)